MLIRRVSSNYVRFFTPNANRRSNPAVFKRDGERRYVIKFSRYRMYFIDYSFVSHNVLTFMKETIPI